jgi:hypothetical protein
MEEMRNAYRNLAGNLKGRNYLEYLVLYLRIILKVVFNKWGVRMWDRFIWVGVRSMENACEQNNKGSYSITGKVFLN